MTRVLHLLTASLSRGGTDAALPALVADTIRSEPGEHHVLLLGGQSLRDAAKQTRLMPTTLLPDTLRFLPGLLVGQSRMGRLLDKSDRVDCWTPRAAHLARKAGASNVQLRFHPDHLTRLAQQYADTRRLEMQRRDALRQQWGVGEHDCVAALIGDQPDTGDAAVAALAAVMVQGVLALQGSDARRIVLLCHPAQFHRPQAQAMLDQADLHDLLIQSPKIAAPWLAFPGCDIAITTADPPPALQHFWAAQAGLTLCSSATGRARELSRSILQFMGATRNASSNKTTPMMPTA